MEGIKGVCEQEMATAVHEDWISTPSDEAEGRCQCSGGRGEAACDNWRRTLQLGTAGGQMSVW
jgi:hypothetical protein